MNMNNLNKMNTLYYSILPYIFYDIILSYHPYVINAERYYIIIDIMCNI